jgi:hypothetical protein
MLLLHLFVLTFDSMMTKLKKQMLLDRNRSKLGTTNMPNEPNDKWNNSRMRC